MGTTDQRKNVYCDQNFLNVFSAQMPPQQFLTDLDALGIWTSVCKFLLSDRIKLLCNFSAEDLRDKKENCDFLRKLWKNSTNGQCFLDFKANEFPLDNCSNGTRLKDVDAIYLTDTNDDVCLNLSNKYGVIVLNPQLIMKAHNLFEDNGLCIAKEQVSSVSWDDILKKIPNNLSTCNSMVIADNYILKDLTSVEKYLLNILDILVPESLDDGITFDLALFYNTNSEQLPTKVYYEQYETIVNWFKERRPLLKVNFVSYKSGAFHDRSIITNNMWIDVGRGINFNDSTVGKSTTVNVLFPFFIGNAGNLWSDAYFTLINDATDFINKGKLTPNEDYWCTSSRDNRILKIKTGIEENVSYEKKKFTPLGKMDLSKINYGFKGR